MPIAGQTSRACRGGEVGRSGSTRAAPFALILLGLLMLRLATHPIFLAPAFIWCLLGGYQLLLRHHHRFMLARPSL